MSSDAVDEDDAVTKLLASSSLAYKTDTHSTAGSTGQSGSYKSVSPTDLTASSRTLIVLLPKKHPAFHDADTVIRQRGLQNTEGHDTGSSKAKYAASTLAGRTMCKRRSWKPESSRMGMATGEPLDQAGLGYGRLWLLILLLAPAVPRIRRDDGAVRPVKRRWPGR